jgi:hypothetical protein
LEDLTFLGVRGYWIARLAKVVLFLSASVIIVDFVGVSRLRAIVREIQELLDLRSIFAHRRSDDVHRRLIEISHHLSSIKDYDVPERLYREDTSVEPSEGVYGKPVYLLVDAGANPAFNPLRKQEIERLRSRLRRHERRLRGLVRHPAATDPVGWVAVAIVAFVLVRVPVPGVSVGIVGPKLYLVVMLLVAAAKVGILAVVYNTGRLLGLTVWIIVARPVLLLALQLLRPAVWLFSTQPIRRAASAVSWVLLIVGATLDMLMS